jgi:hypothetical protein
MKTILDKMLDALPSYFDKESYPLEIFSIAEQSVINIKIDNDNRSISIKENDKETVIDTTEKTIGEIKTLIAAAGFTVNATTDSYDNLYWFTLVAQNLGTKFCYEQSNIRRIKGAVAQCLMTSSIEFNDGILEIYFSKSKSFWLNLWGSVYFGISRTEDESDSDYIQRIKFEILALRSNNYAIAGLIGGATGVAVDIIDMAIDTTDMFFTSKNGNTNSLMNDAGDKLFDGTIQFSSRPCVFGVKVYSGNINDLPAATKAQIIRLIYKYKAGGMFPVYFMPTGLLHTNTIGENTNNLSYCVARNPNSWAEVTLT